VSNVPHHEGGVPHDARDVPQDDSADPHDPGALSPDVFGVFVEAGDLVREATPVTPVGPFSSVLK
jgi:hypothetical protein